MKENFESALKYTLQYEGGYANHPSDKGGETYKGIARNIWKTWSGWKYIDQVIPNKFQPSRIEKQIIDKDLATIAELDNLIKDFYKINFWDKCKCDLLPNKIDRKVFDIAVNMGSKTAIKLLQKTISKLGITIDIDGDFGPSSISALQHLLSLTSIDEIINKLCSIQLQRYKDIIENNPSQEVFREGWTRRSLYKGE